MSECECEVAQSCPTLCSPTDCSLPCSFLPWDFPGKSTGVGCHFLRSSLQINCLDSRQNVVRFKSNNFLKSSGDFGAKQLRSQSPNGSKILNCSPASWPARTSQRESEVDWTGKIPRTGLRRKPVKAFQAALVVKNNNNNNNLPVNAGDIRDVGSIPWSGKSPGGGHGNPFQYSCLENLMDRGEAWAAVHRVTKSQTRLK